MNCNATLKESEKDNLSRFKNFGNASVKTVVEQLFDQRYVENRTFFFTDIIPYLIQILRVTPKELIRIIIISLITEQLLNLSPIYFSSLLYPTSISCATVIRPLFLHDKSSFLNFFHPPCDEHDEGKHRFQAVTFFLWKGRIRQIVKTTFAAFFLSITCTVYPKVYYYTFFFSHTVQSTFHL